MSLLQVQTLINSLTSELEEQSKPSQGLLVLGGGVRHYSLHGIIMPDEDVL